MNSRLSPKNRFHDAFALYNDTKEKKESVKKTVRNTNKKNRFSSQFSQYNEPAETVPVSKDSIKKNVELTQAAREFTALDQIQRKNFKDLYSLSKDFKVTF